MRRLKVWKFKKKILLFKNSFLQIISFLVCGRVFLMSVLSFILGYLLNSPYLKNLKLDTKDIYFADAPKYMMKNTLSDVFLVILIFSSVKNIDHREVIRNTWLSDVKDDQEIVHLFVISLGSASEQQKSILKDEQKKYNDLLIFNNVNDSFFHLTEKVIVSCGWLTDIRVLQDRGKSETGKTFRNFQYLLKCDDDSFVRVKKIKNELKTVFAGEEGESLYWGFFDGRAKPQARGKYREDQWKICDFYIPYALGGGYVLAQSLVHFIANNANFLMQFKSEDISVGAWLATYSGIKRVHDPRFDTEYISRGCHQSYLITHKHSLIAMTTFHENLKNTGRLCQMEFRTRKSYNYNWNVSPSACCVRNNPNIP